MSEFWDRIRARQPYGEAPQKPIVPSPADTTNQAPAAQVAAADPSPRLHLATYAQLEAELARRGRESIAPNTFGAAAVQEEPDRPATFTQDSGARIPVSSLLDEAKGDRAEDWLAGAFRESEALHEQRIRTASNPVAALGEEPTP